MLILVLLFRPQGLFGIRRGSDAGLGPDLLQLPVHRDQCSSGGLLALIAIGLNVHFGYTGLLNFGQAGFMAVGAYGFGIPIVDVRVALVWAGVHSSVLGGCWRSLSACRRCDCAADYLAIVTIAVAEIIRCS